MSAAAAVRILGPRLAGMIKGGRSLLPLGERMTAMQGLGSALMPASKGEWAMEVLPDLVFGGLTALQTGNLGAGAEDAVLGLAGSGLGRLAGGKFAWLRNKGKPIGDAQWAQKAGGAAGVGGLIGGFGSALVPFEMRPFGSQVVAQAEADQRAMFDQAVNQQVRQMAGGMPPVRSAAGPYDDLLAQLDPKTLDSLQMAYAML